MATMLVLGEMTFSSPSLLSEEEVGETMELVLLVLLMGITLAWRPLAISSWRSGLILVTTQMLLVFVGLGDRKIASEFMVVLLALRCLSGGEIAISRPLEAGAGSARAVNMFIDRSLKSN